MEPYLCLVKKHKYQQAIAKFRCSSHTLGIERGRHTNPKTPVADRKCLFCGVIEDEKHYLLNCCVNVTEREYFFHKISHIHDRFMGLNDEEKFLYTLTNRNPQCLTWFDEFVYRSFEKRNAHASSRCVYCIFL